MSNTPLQFLFAILLLSSGARSAFAASAQAVIERSNIMAGEVTVLKVIVEGGAAQSLGNMPTVQGLSLQFAGSGTETTVVNGRRTDRHILNFRISGSQPGQYTIPGIPVVVNGSTISTEPVTINITRNEVPPDSPYTFVRLILPRTEIFVGEVLPIEIQLYVAGRGDNLQVPTLKGDGFVVNKRADHQSSNTQVGNVPYNVVTFKMAVSPAKAGQLQLGPAEMSFTYLVPTQRDPRDPFAGFFGQRYQQRPLTLSSSAQTVNVLPLPRQNVPPSFTGAIGQFTWNVSSSPTNLSAGDPITLKIQVAGQGNWDNVKLPDLKWPGFKSYAPNSNLETVDPLGFRGQKVFEQVVVPEHSGITEIPSFEFAFFDPVARTYQTLSTPATPVQVQSTGGPQVQPALANVPESGGEEDLPPSDIVHIKPSPGMLLAQSQPVILRPWFWLLQSVPLLVFFAAALWRRQQDRLENNPRLRRRLETRKVVQHGLVELREHAQAGRADEFYATTFRLLQEQLGERLDMPPYSITEAVLDERLAQRGASPELIVRLHRLFQLCNHARYAPAATVGDMPTLLPEIESALKELQDLPD